MTLVEMLAALAIIAISIALLSPLADAYNRAGGVRRDAAEIAAALNGARADALAGGLIIDIEIDVSERKFGLAGAARFSINEDTQVQFTGARELYLSDSRGVVRFYPDGSSSGGQIVLTGAREIDVIDIDWLNGSTQIARARNR